MSAAPLVLVVDDDESLSENIAELVETLGATVHRAATAARALELEQEHGFVLALLDVRLPDSDGLTLMAELRRRSPLLQVVLITGDATIESAMAAVREGAFAYLLKPFASEDLLETARRALSQGEGQRERERLRTELERSERRHREVVEAAPAFVLALDAGGRIALWNRRLEEVTGFTAAEMIGTKGDVLIGAAGIRPLPVKSGGERQVRWELARVQAPDSSAFEWTYAVGIDVTQEQEMMRRTMRAERLAAVGTLAAGLAHEVRNPLNSASLQLEVLARRLERGSSSPSALLGVVNTVKEEIRRLDRLVLDFLSFVQPRPLDRRQVDVNELCRSVLGMLTPEAHAAQVSLILELDGALPVIAADPERLRQVLFNLVRNALEAMPGGGTLTVTTRPAREAIELEVEDTGVGFSEDQPVFDAFWTTKPQGTGLGLSIVHRIVTDHGGNIRVASRPGCTRFTVALPVKA